MKNELKKVVPDSHMIALFLLVSVIAFGYVMFEIRGVDEELDRAASQAAETRMEKSKATPDASIPAGQTSQGGSGSTQSTGGTQSVATTPATAQDGVLTVRYTDQGFAPNPVMLNVSEAIRFVNDSSSAMWMTSYVPGTSTTHDFGLDQGRSVGRGGTYTFTFTEAGTWQYQNLNNTRHVGTVTVLP